LVAFLTGAILIILFVLFSDGFTSSFVLNLIHKNMKRILFFIVLTAVLYGGMALTSCKKQGTTAALITVLDSNGIADANVTVTIWQDTAHNPITGVQGNVNVIGVTNASGMVEFTFANEAFLNIWAIKGGDTAFGFIRLEQYQTVDATVRF
jgi:hypothetical protein